MAQNRNVQQSKILLTVILACFFSGTFPALFENEAISHLHEQKTIDDSSNIILFLDTAVLGPFFFPANGKVISPYGRRGRRMHTGTDIKLAHGDTVWASFNGVVTKASHYYGYGILVVLKHPNNLETYYAHLSKPLVKEGDTVQYGTPVGLGGRTGRATTDHLHFEIRQKGKALNSEHFFNFNDKNIVSWVLRTNKKPKAEDFSEEKESTAEEKAIETTEKTENSKKTSALVKTQRKYHTIKKGDTLFSLSRRYDTTVDAICKLNNIKKSSVLKIGRKLRVQ